MEEHLTELIVDTLLSKAIQVQMFFHYFIVYFCVYLLHEDSRVGKLALYHSVILLCVQMLSGSPDYFFHEAILHELILMQVTLLVITGTRVKLLLSLNCISIVFNVLMYEFPTDTIFFYEHYVLINSVLLETTIGILIYDHKSKSRNLVLLLIMLLIYTHEF